MSGEDQVLDTLIRQLEFFAEAGITHLNSTASQPVAPEPVASEATVSRTAAPEATDRLTNLQAIRSDLGDCKRCKLHRGRRNIVFGTGNARADLMFVGEAPGEDEDAQALPFVGKAGQLLTRIIKAIELNREDVYIANILKCRPPDNRDPEPDEVEMCEPFLFRQIEAIKPIVIVALGKYAAQTLLRTTEWISRLRGREFDYRGSLLIPTFHPSYLLRNPSKKREVWEDMQKVRDVLKLRGSWYYR